MKCLLKLIILLYLSRDTSHSPLQGICPSRQYCHSCQRGNVICTVPFNNITALQTGPFAKPIDKLILDGCPDNFTSSNTQLNVTSFHINCTINDDYFTLFHRWNLKEIKDINRNELYTQVSPGINQTCRQACGDTKMPVNGTSSCICVGDANEVEADNSNFYYYIIIGGVSAFTLLVNLIFVIGMCTMAQSSLVGVFGIALMFFNILLAFYGLSMAIYLTQNHTYWHHQFCQGFTSVKLFALGGSVWTMLMLTFHRSVRGDIETEREAIFKGIVYILEGLMLSGVLAVMSWIKLDKWNYLCIVFEPKTTVDWLLTGIELLYYFMMLCLVLRFPYHQIRKKKRTGNQRRDTSLPIFLMVIICFLVWVGSYGVTMHWFDYLFTEKIRRVIRVVAIIFPVSLQPIIFILRNTCCCLCRDSPCSKKKDSDLKVCECIPPDQCDICDNEDYVMRYSANETYEKEQPNGDVKEMVDLKAAKKAKKKKEKKEKKEKKKGKGGKFFTPKSIERSPVTKHKETSFNEDGADSDQGGDAVAETPLIDKDNKTEEADRKEEETAQRRSVGIPTDSTPLLDDTDGEARQPPKATPDGTPKKSAVAPDYPSFVHMDSAIDVDSLPKEKAPITLSKLAATNNAVKANKQPQQPQQLQPDLLEEERKSRGPTFFPLAEKKDVPEPKPSKKKTKKKSDKSNGMKNGEKDAPKKSKPKKPKKNERENGEKAPNRNSIVSLEWDHYSDSSSGSVSRSSDYFPDDLTVVPVTETEENNSDQKQTTNTQSNGISRTGSKKSNNMEWDPTGGVESNDGLLKNNKNKSEIPTAKTNGKIATAAS